MKEIFARVESSGFASFPVSRSSIKYPALLEVTGRGSTYEVELRDLSAAFSFVQLLPGNKILVASARCMRFKDGTHELNACIYDTNGRLQSEFLLGDGIQRLQTDKSGQIWVGYSDEGVYGNFGWSGSGNAAPVGATGLVSFDESGKKLWEYEPVSGTDFISDLYALNVFGDEAWAYYYTGFPLVRIKSNKRLEAWTTQTSGARAFALGNEKVLLFGGYRDQSSSCRWLRLGEKEATVEQPVTLLLSEGESLRDAIVTGRGNILHVFVGEKWYQFSTASID